MKIKELNWFGDGSARSGLGTSYKVVQHSDECWRLYVSSNDGSSFMDFYGTDDLAFEAAQAHFDAAIASVVEEDWQTMETAPKDGTNILLAENGVTSEAYWSETGMGWWAANTHHTDYVDGQIYAPTNWRPLPTPPGDE